MFRRFVLPLLVLALGGCATVSRTVESGADRAGRSLAQVGDAIESGAQSAGEKTRTLWQRLFGGASSGESRTRRDPAPSPAAASSREPAQFDTYAQERVGG